MAISSEYHAYVYIKKELESLGWNISNPSRKPDGEVYTQNECLQNPLLKKYLNLDKPENVIIVRDKKFWVIEAKPLHRDIDKAVSEAQAYAAKLNHDHIYAPLITAVAGNDEDTYLVKSFYYSKGNWLPVKANGRVMTGLLPKDIARYFVDNDTNQTADFNLPDELYYAKAKNINEILHIGSINKNNRAKVMSALLLAMLEDTPLNLDNTAYVLISEINSRVEKILSEHGKRDFAKFLQITTPPTPDNHVKFRKALIDTIQELEGLNIRSAMNSGTDILGRFYEVFLKYGNGAKEIGIVLTPRHITKFGVEVIGVNRTDIIFDPACGTGGFLVAAFDHVKKQSNQQQIDDFKKNNIFGIEQEPEVLALALVNMIFRGDGKNNIIEGNCLVKKIPTLATKVLMNPPFALKKDDEKEYRFIDRALEQMEDNGLLFVVIPSTIMLKGRQLKTWREKLLRGNTLEAVVKLPEDLFYPVGVHTSAAVIRKGIPHNQHKEVFWGNLVDGCMKKKGVMKPSSDVGNIALIRSTLQSILSGATSGIKKSVPFIYTLSPILFDGELECAPEYYLEEGEHTPSQVVEEMNIVLNRLFTYMVNNPHTSGTPTKISSLKPDDKLDSIFDFVNAKSNNIEDYSVGNVPFVTSTELNNGVEKFIEPDDQSLVFTDPCIALTSFGFATVQLPPFVGRSHGAVVVLKPKKELTLVELSYFAAQINLQKWRFSYGRWVTKKRLLKLNINPTDDFDLPSMSEIIKRIDDKYRNAKDIING